MTASIQAEGQRVKLSIGAFGRALFVVGALSGCSSIPDAVNPATWFSSSDEPAIATPKGRTVAATDADAPAPAEGLVADHSHQYAGSVHRDVTASKPLVRRPSDAPQVATTPGPVPTARPSTTSPQSGLTPPAFAGAELSPGAKQIAQMTSPNSGVTAPSTDPRQVAIARTELAPPQLASAPMAAPARSTHPVEDEYQRRLTESGGLPLPQSDEFAAPVDSGSSRIHLVPPSGGRGKGLAAPMPAPSSYQVAALDFRATTTTLTAQDRKALAAVAKLYRRTGGTIRIVGSAPDGSGAYNRDAVQRMMHSLEGSMQRANAVARELTHQGVPAAKVFVGAAPANASARDGAGARVYLDY